MQKFLKFAVARWLVRTPLGLVVLGIGWFLARRRRRRRAEREAERPAWREDRARPSAPRYRARP